MTQREKRIFLIEQLLSAQPQFCEMQIPQSTPAQKRLLRTLMNLRAPQPVDEHFLQVQDEYLQSEIQAKGITDFSALAPIAENVYLWQGDITTLRCDAIVNAANSALLGCFCPCHGCIDNAIHTYAGIALRLECAEIMQRQGHPEPAGRAKSTKAYNLPCRYILHTVGPIVRGSLTQRDCDLLASCYRSCLTLAEQKNLRHIAFCCISTGEYHFPKDRAAEIAIQTVRDFLKHAHSNIQVIFNVFTDADYKIYRELLG